MAGFDVVIDITNIPPEQGGSAHTPGKWKGTITNTQIKPTKDESGGMLVITLTSEGGSIDWRLNLWNQSTQAQDIAQKQLSALGHAIGVFKFNMKSEAAEIRGAPLMYDVGPQVGNEKYMEVKKIYDANGNEPGKAPTNQGSAFGAQPSPAANNATGQFGGAVPNPSAATGFQGGQTGQPAPANAWGGQGGGAPAGGGWQGNAGQPAATGQPWQQGGGAAGSTDKPPWQK